MQFCPDKKCMDPVLKLDNDHIQFVKKLSYLVWFGIQNSHLNSNILKHGVKNPWTSWKSSLVQNGVQNYIIEIISPPC